MVLNRTEFLKQLRMCRPGVEKNKAALEGMDCFIFKNKRLHTYNGFISVSIETGYPFECAVAADEFYRVISSFKAKEITIEEKDDHLFLECGKAKAIINRMSEGIYKQIVSISPEEPQWKALPPGFMEGLRYAFIRNTDNTGAEKTDGIYINNEGIFSTDLVVINHVKLPFPMDPIWLTSKMVGELLRYPDLDSYCLQDSWAIFKSGDLVFCCRKFIDAYPISQIRSAITEHATDGMSGSLNAEFAEAIEGCLVFAMEKEDRHFISLEFQSNGIKVFSRSSAGEYSEFVECPIEDWRPATAVVDGTRLRQALKRGVDISFYMGYVDEQENAFILSKDNWTELFLLYKE